MLDIDLSSLSRDELHELRKRVTEEINALTLRDNAEHIADNALRTYRLAVERGVPAGEVVQWVQPTGAHDAYPKEWTVLHDNKLWVSTVTGNVWEPGVSGWMEHVEDDSYPTWVQPSGAHDAYPRDYIVIHNEGVYRSTVNANVWEPGVFGWELIEGEEPIDPPEEEEPTDPPEEEEPIDPPDEEPPVEEPDASPWVQPTGAHDTYNAGDVVAHNGKAWVSTVNANTWEPGVYGWDEL